MKNRTDWDDYGEESSNAINQFVAIFLLTTSQLSTLSTE